jgi:alanine racemase
LSAVASNVQSLVRHVAPARMMAVVKGDGYGHGAVMVARTALAHGADCLGVYTVSEGVTLRDAGIASSVVVFGPFTRAEVDAIWDQALTPTVTSVEAADRLMSRAAGRRLPVHIKLDTGLHRSGVAPEEAASLLERLSGVTTLAPEGIYTHFASADEPDKSTTHEQIRLFTHAVATLESQGFRFAVRHASNSAATLDIPGARFDMVRCGIALYGYYPSAAVRRDVELLPALSLVSEVTRVHHIAPGTGVGYGHEFRADRTSTIALVPIGYGDGLPRSLGHGRGRVLIGGEPAPIVGRVSMDQITIDVSDIRDVRVGDAAVLIGAQGATEQSADDLAEQAGTISYDILTGLLPRVPRLYAQGEAIRSVLEPGSRIPVAAWPAGSVSQDGESFPC